MVRTSALHKRGLNELRNVISKKALGEEPLDTADKIVPSLRHRQALEKSLGSAIAAQTGMHDKISPELTAIEIKDSLDSLGEISGKTATNEILDQIFARFCIGK